MFQRVCSAIYVISTPERIQQDLYKIGKTTQEPKELLARYKTPLIHPIILAYIPCTDPLRWEKQVHKHLSFQRVEESEWYHTSLLFIFQILGTLSLDPKEAVQKVTLPSYSSRTWVSNPLTMHFPDPLVHESPSSWSTESHVSSRPDVEPSTSYASSPGQLSEFSVDKDPPSSVCSFLKDLRSGKYDYQSTTKFQPTRF